MSESSPFKFLDAYEKDDIQEYFGRKQETEELFKKTFESNLILVYGLSGTGKTSLVRCGLANMFADTDWLPLLIRRQDNIIESLQTAVREAAFEKEGLEEKPLRQQIHSLYLDYYKPIYLLFDQFEELFIIGSREEANRFFWLLAELLKAKLQIKILLIMREEYLAHLDRFEQIIPRLFDTRFRVERMRVEHLQEVILCSADRFDIRVSDPREELTARIIENIRNERGQIDLANLQVYLDRLYRDDIRRRGDEERPIQFDQALLDQTGQLDDVLARFLDEQLQTINRELLSRDIRQDDIPLSVLSRLVTNEETKQPQSIGTIVQSLHKEKEVPPEIIEYCIQRLEEMRIIRYLT